jgi:HK97 family phage portal protein
MRLVSASGELVPVRERAWPQAGLTSPGPIGSGRSVIQLATAPGGPPNYASYAQVYRTNPWVYACVNMIATGLARMKVNVHAYDTNGDHEQILVNLPGGIGRPNSGLALAQLLATPEPGVSRHEWLRKMIVDRLVYGNAIAVMDRPSGAGVPSALWHTPWQRITINTGDTVPILNYVIEGDRGNRVIDPIDVVHLGRGGDLNSPAGLSAIAPLRYTIALHDALQRHLNAYFKNSARPSGMIQIQPGTNKEAITLIQEQVNALYSAPENAGKILVTSGAWHSLSADPQSSNIVELAKLSREEIAAAFQVPPPMLGILERALKSNVIEMRSQFVRDVIGPHADAIEQDLQAQLLGQNPAWRGYFVRFDLNGPLMPDLEARATVYEKMRHVYTPNEMRQMEGKKPLTGDAGEFADTLWMPSGEIPLGLEQPQTAGANGEAEPEDGGTDPGQPDPSAPGTGEDTPGGPSTDTPAA